MQEVKFETFKDGVVELYAIDDNGDKEKESILKARFSNRIVGEAQYYGALAANVKISRRIKIPMFVGIDEDSTDAFYAQIGDALYSVKRAQHYQGTKPPTTQLTLNYIRGKSDGKV